MSDEAKLIGEAARGILGRPIPPEAPWTPVLDGGWIGIGLNESDGGQGGTLVEAAAVAEAAGVTAASAPVIESIMAAMVLGSCESTREMLGALSDGSVRAALVPEVVRSDRSGCVVDLELVVPWGASATVAVLVAVLAEGGLGVAAVPVGDLTVVTGTSLAGDPLDRLRLPGAQLPAVVHVLDVSLEGLIEAAAVLTAARMCGALRAVADLSLDYAKQRSQFGRPIGSFQVLAHDLARQAACVAQAEVALANALTDGGGDRATRAEVARVVASQAVSPVIKIAHQVHGAIGVTREHDLHRYTLRLQEWRSCWGSASWWSRRLGRRIIAGEQWWDDTSPALLGTLAVHDTQTRLVHREAGLEHTPA